MTDPQNPVITIRVVCVDEYYELYGEPNEVTVPTSGEALSIIEEAGAKLGKDPSLELRGILEESSVYKAKENIPMTSISDYSELVQRLKRQLLSETLDEENEDFIELFDEKIGDLFETEKDSNNWVFLMLPEKKSKSCNLHAWCLLTMNT